MRARDASRLQSEALNRLLKRYPVAKDDPLQAWDAADELVLEQVASLGLPAGARIAVLGDSFGALSAGLIEQGLDAHAVTYTDSYCSSRGIAFNTDGRARVVSLLSDLPGELDLAIVRVPKSLAFLEDQLCALSARLRPGAPVVFGYMVKHQANAAFGLIARTIGPTRTSLAKKKARLIFAELSATPTRSPYPTRVRIEGFETPFLHHSNLFSRERLDIGTRFFLEHLREAEVTQRLRTELPKSPSVLDLGCGNGIVGIAIQTMIPQARLIFVDDSRMALESARESFALHHPDAALGADFRWTNGFEDGEPESVDLVLCNPPFHQGTTVGEHIARRMFRDAHRALRAGGALRVIGNSHLPYFAQLSRLFGAAEIVARNAKFTIVDARKLR